MSYIDAMKIRDTINIVERIKTKRVFQKIPAKYVFYVKSNKGTYKSIYGDPLIKFETSNYKKFLKEKKLVRENALFEDDINPIFRYLEETYKNTLPPNLHVIFFDIEVDFDPARGFSNPEDPYCPVNAISLYQKWKKKLITLTLKPDTITWDEAVKICDQFDNTILCINEEELFDKFFEIIDDCDVLSGWNSNTFDIPYLIRRLEKIKNKEATKRFCLWNQYPTKKTFEMYGKDQLSYELHGRIHLDYLDLYRKHTYHELHSYSLDNVGEYEVNEKKIAYEGSLDKLYKFDYKTFIDYNRQDTMLLVKIDEKNDFITLSNNLAHENCVLLNTTLGSVALIEQAIVKEIHEQNLIVPSKKFNKLKDHNNTVAGAYVTQPKKGMHEWVGSVDINSLYPSVIRSLNMSPETIMGQFRLDKTISIINERLKKKNTSGGDAWSGFFGVIEYQKVIEKSDDLLTVDLEDGTVMTQTGKDWYKTIFNSQSNLCLSANGTLFRTDVKGIIPGLLERWYAERLELKEKASELEEQLKKIKNKKEKEKIEDKIDFYNQRQLIKKILLNSLYGALLNQHCRFFDQRLGQSVTLSGRCINKHMISKINEIFTNNYDHNGETIIYGDTDSCYFSAYSVLKNTDFKWTKNNVLELYETVSKTMNDSFSTFMVSNFNTTEENGKIIKAAREVCAIKGLFIKKKRYALLAYDISGKRYDVDDSPGKIKAMGVDLKRADTPKSIQTFLNNVLLKVLTGEQEEKIKNYVKEFRKHFQSWPGWEKGTPKRVNGLTKKIELEQTLGKVAMAGHQRASFNWNKLKEMHNDKYSITIQDGSKVIVCKLKRNPLGYTSIAYPIDQEHLPAWFKELPFDHEAMEEALIDSKLDNLVGVLKWKFKNPEDNTTFNELFSIKK